ncbi:MAG TPA: septum formation initiator family protein [Gaiellaceae bacterium]|nr:septum formation initiator family protein [Gaiellaceae bacterium]
MEPGVVAGRARAQAPARRTKTHPRVQRRRVRALWFVAILGITVYLYYRPLASYLETRNDLSERRAEVEALKVARAQLELRLVNSMSVEATEREARRSGYVKPGEQLFVVKGIPAWRQARSAARDRRS